MTDLTKLLDYYDRNARLYPALLTILPALIMVLALMPDAERIGKSLLALLVGCGALVALSNYARSRGRSVQKQLLKRWGGWPTTIFLRHSDEHLSKSTKARYHAFLRGRLGDQAIPSEELEAADSTAADERLDSCIAWLKEQTRGSQFDLLLKENASYGFRRNVLGLRSAGIAICVLSFLAPPAVQFARRHAIDDWISFLAKSYVDSAATTVTTGICLIALIAWLRVNPQWVRAAAELYATSLLACCDMFDATSR